MSSLIPLTFRLAPLPEGFVGTPQQIATAIVARLSAVSANSISFFASGSVAPTSNVGPWLKNDQTWYVWSDPLATYVPEIIDSQSLGYTASQDAPDPTKFTFWFKLDGSGNPIGIFYYANGSWQDVYASIIANYSTTAQMNTAITAAVGSQSKYAFSAIKAVNQIVTANSGPATIELPSEQYDLGNAYDIGTYKFTAPVAGVYRFTAGILIGLDTGTPTDVNISILLAVNGSSVFGLTTNDEHTDLNSRSMAVTRDVLLTAGQTVEAKVDITTTGASTWVMDTNSAANFLQGSLVQSV